MTPVALVCESFKLNLEFMGHRSVFCPISLGNPQKDNRLKLRNDIVKNPDISIWAC
jgi:hypothetical protein